MKYKGGRSDLRDGFDIDFTKMTSAHASGSPFPPNSAPPRPAMAPATCGRGDNEHAKAKHLSSKHKPHSINKGHSYACASHHAIHCSPQADLLRERERGRCLDLRDVCMHVSTREYSCRELYLRTSAFVNAVCVTPPSTLPRMLLNFCQTGMKCVSRQM